MSYARFGCDGSDVYVYAGSVGIECCGCALSADETDPAPMSHDQAIAHLRLHVAAGQRAGRSGQRSHASPRGATSRDRSNREPRPRT